MIIECSNDDLIELVPVSGLTTTNRGSSDSKRVTLEIIRTLTNHIIAVVMDGFICLLSVLFCQSVSF